MKLALKLLLTVGVFLVIGLGVGHVLNPVWPDIKRAFLGASALYTTPDEALYSRFESADAQWIEWQSLLPEHERSVLEQYQQKQAETVDDFTQQILRSLQATHDQDYQSAMQSMNTVATFNEDAVSMAGFVVPLDFHEDKSPSLIFLVPYYGACIHFPPPPPNQIIFARLDPGFTDLDMVQAYRLDGFLRQGLFEDPMGTSAYQIDVVSIQLFSGQPDDFRQH